MLASQHLRLSSLPLATAIAFGLTLQGRCDDTRAPAAAIPAVVAAPQAVPAKPALNHLANNGPPKSAADKKSSASPPVDERSQAEQITRLERTIERDQMRLEQLRADLQSPESEFNLAEAAFKSIDEALTSAQADAATLAEDGDTAGHAEAQMKIADLTTTWKLARERFDLAIESR
jgi:hypothetical protein